jgi:hypothetical protein
MAVFETTRPDEPLAITARAGGDEPAVIAIGEDPANRFEWRAPGQPPDAPPDAAA